MEKTDRACFNVTGMYIIPKIVGSVQLKNTKYILISQIFFGRFEYKYIRLIIFTPIFPYIDRNGRTALHYAAALSEFDDTGMYGWLMNSGYDSAHQDNVRNLTWFYFV